MYIIKVLTYINVIPEADYSVKTAKTAKKKKKIYSAKYVKALQIAPAALAIDIGVAMHCGMQQL